MAALCHLLGARGATMVVVRSTAHARVDHTSLNRGVHFDNRRAPRAVAMEKGGGGGIPFFLNTPDVPDDLR